MDGHKHEGLSDEMLEREIEAALGVDPSPEFLPRLRARIASERLNQGWVWAGLWRWAGAGVAVAAVVIAGLWVSSRSVPAPREAQSVEAPQDSGTGIREPGLAARAANSDSSPTPAPVRRPVVHKTRVPRDAVVAAPEVVISQEEAAALRALFTAVSNRRLEPSELPDLAAALKPPDPIEDLIVEPIIISPLAPLEGE